MSFHARVPKFFHQPPFDFSADGPKSVAQLREFQWRKSLRFGILLRGKAQIRISLTLKLKTLRLGSNNKHHQSCSGQKELKASRVKCAFLRV